MVVEVGIGPIGYGTDLDISILIISSLSIMAYAIELKCAQFTTQN